MVVTPHRRVPCVVLCAVVALVAPPAAADSTYQSLPFSQSWSNTALITTNDDWSGVPGVEGFRGDNLTSATGVDPQTVLAPDDPGVLDVNANQTNPNGFTTGGATEFELADPVVALTGSGTADAPYLRIYLNTTGISGITVSYTLRDLEDGGDNAVQPVALQYRVGASGDFTNVPAAFVADATQGPNIAGPPIPVSVTLPAAVDNQPQVQLRIITTNAVGNDEWVGVDDLSVTSGAGGGLSVSDVAVFEGDSGTVTASFTLSLTDPAPSGGVTFDIATADGTATTADNDYVPRSLTGQTIPAGGQGYTFDVTVNGDTAVEPDEAFFVDVTNVVGVGLVDGQGLGTILNDDVALVPIHDIQGSGATSPLVGTVVDTRGVVTGRRSNGFYLQAPDAEADGDPLTSEGIYVFTGSAPPAAAAVGNLVRVNGTVVEFVPSADPMQPPVTELTGPTVSLLATGSPLPTAALLDPAFPSAAGAFDQLERLEGMRVAVASLEVVGATLGSVNEPSATTTSNGVFFGVVTGVARPFREAGIQAPDPPPAGTIPPIPRFDTNPEVIRVDSDGLVGGVALDVGAGATVTGLVGPLDYAFRRYTILPDPASPPTAGGGPTPSAATPPTSQELTVASMNLLRFFNDVDDPGINEPVLTAAAFDRRLGKVSEIVRNRLHFPDVIGLEEVENLATLQSLASRISSDAVGASQPDPLYVAYLEEGNDVGGIDVGFLVKTAPVSAGTPRVTVNAVVQENAGESWVDPQTGLPDLLNDRPPLRLDAVVNHPNTATFPLTVIVVHQRSLGGINDETVPAGGLVSNGERVRQKRYAQAVSLATLVDDRQTADPTERILVIGDLNGYEVNDGMVDVVGTVIGTPVPDDQTALSGDGVDLVDPDMTNLTVLVPGAQRYSYVYDGNAQNLDHMLVGAALVAATDARRLEHPRVNADFPAVAANGTDGVRASDHEPLLAYFEVAEFPVSLVTFTVD